MISLIVTTRNRSEEIKNLLNSLLAQSHKNFELIIVDQSDNDLTEKTVNSYQGQLIIKYEKTKQRGASRGKNRGIQLAKGDLLGFPDDDCWYHSDLLKKVLEIFNKENCDLLSIPVVDPNINDAPIMPFLSFSQKLNLDNVWHGGVVAGIFSNKSFVSKIQFDNDLGVGSGTIYESGEETDFMIRGIQSGFYLYFSTDTQVYHPLKDTNIGSAIVLRNYKYGAGLGRVLRKNHYSLRVVLKNFIRPAGGAIIYFFKGDFLRSKAYVASLCGRLKGYFC